MVCPNCHSTEIVAIQGENYCITCGQLVPKVDPSVPVSTDGLPAGVTILPLADDTAATGKRKRGRPKAGRLDNPKPITEHIIATPAPASLPSVFRPQLADLRKITPAPATAPVQSEPSATARAGYGTVLRSSLSGRWSEGRMRLALVPAAILAMLVAATALVFVVRQPGEVVAITTAGGPAIGGELIILTCLYYLTRSLAHGAIIYGSARLADHRPADQSLWLDAALGSQSRRLGLDLYGAFGSLIALGLAGGLAWLGSSTWHVPELAQTGLLATGYALIIYGWLAIIMSVSLAHVATTLAGVHVGSSLRLGWKLFYHHFELAGARLVALLVELICLVPLVAAAGALVWYTPAASRPLGAAGAAVIVTLAGALAGAGTAIWWQAAYRTLIRLDHPAGFNRLMAAHAPAHLHRGARASMTATLLLLSGLAAAWPWLAG